MIYRLRFAAIVLAGAAVLMSSPAHADTAAPPPPIVVGTGGSTGGSSPGTGCSARSGTVVVPHATSSPYAWAEPDWPGFATVDTPTPAISCSR